MCNMEDMQSVGCAICHMCNILCGTVHAMCGVCNYVDVLCVVFVLFFELEVIYLCISLSPRQISPRGE